MIAPRVGRALRHRNYRLFFAGQGVSLIGTWLTRFAMGYETYALSHSTLQLGLVAFFSQAPTAVMAPVAGVLVDRWDRHRTLVVTQQLALLQSAALAVFALTGAMTVWHLLVLAAVQGGINAFDMPARQAFVRQMVEDRADLPNAIALNSTLVNTGRLIGPVIAALLVALVGVGWCFAIDAASYLAVIASLLAMRVTAPPPRPRAHAILHELRDGLRYVAGVPLVRRMLLLLLTTSVCGGAYASQLPAIAAGSLGGGAHTLGWLMGATGAGALTGALYLASREGTQGLARIVGGCAIVVGLGLAALELVTATWIAVPILYVVATAMMVQWAGTNTVVQTVVDDDKIGRVMSLYAVVFFGGTPIGALLDGAIATQLGPIHTLALGGAACVICALVFRPSRRSAASASRSSPPRAA